MVRKNAIERDLENLRRVLPDPFDLPSKLDVFFSDPTAQKLIAGGRRSIQRIISLLESNPNPALARVAVLLLSRFAPAAFYANLLVLLEKTDRAMTEAFEPGFWLIQLPEQQIAQDLVSVVASSGNPYPLLLLQKPVAKVVRSQLAGFVQQRRLPLSLYALYCYKYAMEPEDIPLMKFVSRWVDVPEMSALAGLYLLELGSKDGVLGIRAGLIAPDEELRMVTYYELAAYLPKTVVEQSGYDPVKPGNAQQDVVDILINYLT